MIKKYNIRLHSLPDHNIPDSPDVYVVLEPQVVSEEDEYGQVTLRCELASGHPAIINNVTWYKVNQDFQLRLRKSHLK